MIVCVLYSVDGDAGLEVVHAAEYEIDGSAGQALCGQHVHEVFEVVDRRDVVVVSLDLHVWVNVP